MKKYLWEISVIATAILLVLSLWLIFFVAPVEARMGIVQKIFYFHVPSAYAMYLCFTICGGASIVYLKKRSALSDALATASGEVGLLFCIVVLVTGPLWARKAWGVFWTWDPRLTTTMLAGAIFGACAVLRAFADTGELEKRFAAALAAFGLFDLPIIHYSVKRWRGTHPAVISGKGGGLAPDMVPALVISFIAFTLLAAVLIWQRARIAKDQQTLLKFQEVRS